MLKKLLLTNSMNYNFSLSNGSDSCLYNHTGDIIHVFTHDGRGIRTRTDVALWPSIVMYVALPYCATESLRGIRTGMDEVMLPGIAMYVVLTYCATETFGSAVGKDDVHCNAR